MFKKEYMPTYQYIHFYNSIKDPTLAKVKETDPAILNQMIQAKSASGTDEDYDQAILYSQKLAIYHGTPGLIHFVNLLLQPLPQQLKDGEPIEQPAFNALSYLYVAEEVYKLNPSAADKLMAQLMPGETVNSKDYWNDKRAAICKLAEIDYLMDEAMKVGQGLMQQKIPQLTP